MKTDPAMISTPSWARGSSSPRPKSARIRTERVLEIGLFEGHRDTILEAETDQAEILDHFALRHSAGGTEITIGELRRPTLFGR